MAQELIQETLQPQSALSDRVSRLEGAYPHLASKADLERLQLTLIKWIVGTGIALFAALLAAMQVFLRLPN